MTNFIIVNENGHRLHKNNKISELSNGVTILTTKENLTLAFESRKEASDFLKETGRKDLRVI